jgi:hypothetical protein
MALNPLTLTISSGVIGKRFKSAVSGITAGNLVEVMSGSAPGFGYSNGMLGHEGLPYDMNLAILRERNEVTGENRTTNLLISGAGAYAIQQQATSMVAGGRHRTAPVARVDGSLEWNVFVESALGATSSAVIGGAVSTTLGTLTLSGSLQIGTATSGTILGATAGSSIVSNIPGITVNSAARTYSGTPTGSPGAISNGLVETLAGASNNNNPSSITVAASSVGPTAVPTTIHMGIPTHNSITVVHRLANDTSGARLVASTADDFSASPIYSSSANSSSSTVRHTLTGLSAGTTYFLGLETNGAITPFASGNAALYIAGKTWTGTFKTAAAAAGTAQSFRWGFGSCQTGYTAGAALTGMRVNHPNDFFIHLGDLHYFLGWPTLDQTGLEDATDQTLQGQHSGKFFKYTPVAYMPDDHDGLGNDATEFSHTPQSSFHYPLIPGQHAAFMQYITRRLPVTPPVATATGDLSYSFVRGRVRFIVLDSRTRKRLDIASGSATITSNVTASTTISITMATTGGAHDSPPQPGMNLWINNLPTRVNILTVSPSPAQPDADGLGTGTISPFTCTLSGPVTATAGQSVRAQSQMFGPVQMTWILNELDLAAAASQFVVLAFPNGWEHTGWEDDWHYELNVGDDPVTGELSMVSEHRAISDRIIANGLNRKTVVIGGDNHCTQIDTGANMDYSTSGGLMMPSIRVCPLEAQTRAIGITTDWDVYNEAFVVAGGTDLKTSAACYVDVTDTGGSSIQLDFKPVHSSNNTTASDYTDIPSAAYSITLPVPAIQPMSGQGVNVVQWARSHCTGNTTGGWTSQFQNPVTSGNLLIAMFVTNFAASMGSGFAVQSGWTQVGANSGTASIFEKSFWKIAGGSEPQVQVWGNSPNTSQLEMIVVEISSSTGWAANPIDATAADPGTSTQRTSTSVGITTTAANRPVISLFSQAFSGMHSQKPGFGWQGGLTQVLKTPLPELPQCTVAATIQAASGAATYGYTTPDTVPVSTGGFVSGFTSYTCRMMQRVIALKPN